MPNSKTQWTFMVYMAGDNSLDSAGPPDLREMKKVGSTDQLNILAQFDRATGHATERYRLRKGTPLAADSVAKLGKVNTGDPKRLGEFIAWAGKNYPADHYALVLWNHGNGWDDTDIYAGERHRSLRRLATGRARHALFHTPVRSALEGAKRDPKLRAILYDDDAKDFLDNQELKQVLAAGRKLLGQKFDLLGTDACLMSMAEIGCQIHDSASFFAGSEQTEPNAGWPYHTILAELARNPFMSAQNLSKVIVGKYLASYRSDSVTLSACDLSRANSLVTAISALVRTLKPGLSNTVTRQKVLSARTQVQSYDIPDNIDLVDFCSLLSQACAGTDLARRCEDVIDAVKTGYVIANGSKGADLKNSHGVAIYFPMQAVSPLYAKLDFSRQTGWNSFLNSYQVSVRSRSEGRPVQTLRPMPFAISSRENERDETAAADRRLRMTKTD